MEDSLAESRTTPSSPEQSQSQTEALYQYEPISAGMGTRVLILHPGNWDEEIACHLDQIKLDANSHFEALSYVWGDPSSTRPIQCCDGKISITTNLFDALRRLRLADQERRIWADAICINQQDAVERSTQVQNMAQVYATAERTLIWLGEETEETANAIHAMLAAQELLSSYVGRGAAAFNRYKYLGTEANWASLGALLCHPWFRRKWVIQEIVMSKEATALHGSNALSWEIVESVILAISTHEVGVGLKQWIVSFQTDQTYVIATSNFIKVLLIRQQSQKPRFANLLFNTRGFLCSDPRDQFFAIFGLAVDSSTLPATLRPDYTVSNTQLALNFVKWSLSHRQSLDFLFSTTRNIDLPGQSMPSWFPDMSQPDYSILHSDETEIYNASEGSLLSASIDETGTRLHLSSILIDQVDELAPVFDNTTRGLKEFKTSTNIDSGEWLGSTVISYLQHWSQTCKAIALTRCHGTPSQRLISMARTMFCDHVIDGKRCSPYILRRVVEYFAWIQSFHLETYNDWLNEMAPPYRLIETNLFSSTQFRRFGATAAGRLGTFPASTQVGDKVCVFYGGRNAYVIRASNAGTYQFIGPCYLDGMMDGEAMRLGLKSEEITLI